MPFDPDFWTETLGELAASFLTWIPRLVGALALLILGWVVARIGQFILTGLLRRVGMDRLAERVGATRLLTNAGFDPSFSHQFSRVVYWLVLLVFILASAESLGLPGVAETFSGLLAYLPHVLAAALILLLGGLVARVVGEAVGALVTQAGAEAGSLLGQAVRYVLLILVVILAIEQLGVETALLVDVAVVIVAASALALAISFGIGSRELARNVMAGFQAKEDFSPGQELQVRQHRGRLVRIGPVKSELEIADGRVSIPNLALVEEEVVIVQGEEAR